MSYLDMLAELGWTQSELARRLDIHRNSVSKWKGDAPGYALAYLELALAIKRHGEVLG